MESERRVRYTDEYVPGPEGCPVWAIELSRTHSLVFYIRAEDEEKAWHLMEDYYDKHACEIDHDIMDTDPVSNSTIWRHMEADEGWNEEERDEDDE